MEPYLLILVCLLVAVVAEFYLARHRCQRANGYLSKRRAQRHDRLREDVQ